MPPKSPRLGGKLFFLSLPLTPTSNFVDTLLSFDTYLTLLINGSDSVWLDNFAMLCTKAWVWVPLYFVIVYDLSRTIKRPTLWYILGGLILCVLVSDQVSSSIVKPLVCRPRPTHDPAIMHLVDTVNNYRGGHYGFFSSHAANTMSVAVFMSLITRRPSVCSTLLFWSILNCWTRLYLGVHFVGDILVGLAFGVCVAFTIHWLINRFAKAPIPTFPISTSRHIISATFAVPIFASIAAIFQ